MYDLAMISVVLLGILFTSITGQDLWTKKPEVFIEGQPGEVTCTYNNQFTTFTITGPISKIAITTCRVQLPKTCKLTTNNYSPYYRLSKTNNSVTVHIDSVNRTRDDGQWRCEAFVSLSDQPDESIIIDVKVPVSSVVITNKNEDLVKDRSVNFECKSIGGHPVPNITWSIDSRIVKTSVNTATSSLSYEPVVSDQGQRLQCLANNGYGQSQTDSFQLDIKYKPVVDIKPSITPYKLIQGQTFQLECQVNQSNPVVTSYKWYRNGELRTESSSTYTVSNDGSYSCSASNSVGESDTSRVVSVEILYPPTVSTPQSTYSIIESNTLTLSCIATSNPLPNSYSWSGPNNFLQSQQNLTIPGINRNQTGLYTCTVTNIMISTTGEQQSGTGTGSTTVNVLSAPDIPTNARLRYITINTICIEWIPGFNGGAVQSFIVQHSTDDKTWVNSSTILDCTCNGRVDYCIEGLEPDTSYYIRVIARNKYGESLIEILTKSKPHTTAPRQADGRDFCDDRFGAGIGTGLGIALAIHVIVLIAVLLYKYRQGKRKKTEQSYDSVDSRAAADAQTYQELNIVPTPSNTKSPQNDDAVRYYNLGPSQNATNRQVDDTTPYANLRPTV